MNTNETGPKVPSWFPRTDAANQDPKTKDSWNLGARVMDILSLPVRPFVAYAASEDPKVAIVARHAISGTNGEAQEELWDKLEKESTDELIRNIAKESIRFDEAVMRIVILESRGVKPKDFDEKSSYDPKKIDPTKRQELVKKLKNTENDRITTQLLINQYRQSGLVDSSHTKVLKGTISVILDTWEQK